MNAAAKAIHQSNLFNGRFVELRVSKKISKLLILSLVLLLNALAVIYVTNAYRIGYNDLQRLDQQAQRLKLQHGQLLLEQSSLATPSRVEKLAVDNLKMHFPIDKNTYVLQ